MSKLGSFVRLPVSLTSENLYQATADTNSDSVILTQTPKFVSVVNVSIFRITLGDKSIF